jgi:hypothetical protein
MQPTQAAQPTDHEADEANEAIEADGPMGAYETDPSVGPAYAYVHGQD